MIPNGNIINDCGENVHFRLLKFGIFDPKKAKSAKSLKRMLEHFIRLVITKNIKVIPKQVPNGSIVSLNEPKL